MLKKSVNCSNTSTTKNVTSNSKDKNYNLKEGLPQLKVLFAFFNIARDMLCIVNLDGNFELVNPAFETVLGYPIDEILGTNFLNYVHPMDKEATIKEFKKTRSGKSTINFENRFYCKDGSYKLLSWSTNIDESTHSSYSVARDITQARETQIKLRYMHAKEQVLRQSLEERMQQRVEFTRALVHEIKTPLSPLIATSELLMQSVDREPLISYAHNINTGALELNNRINELLDLAKGEVKLLALGIEAVDVRQVIEGAANYMKSRAEKEKHRIILNLPEDMATVPADGQRLREVIINLLDNAIKYSAGGTEIFVKARQGKADIIIEVEDFGYGISAKEMPNLFEPYKRLHAKDTKVGGIGLGLALSKMLIELHGGKLWVKSRKNKGSKFSLSLPLQCKHGGDYENTHNRR